MQRRELASKRKDVEWSDKIGVGEANPNYNGGKYIDDKGYVRILSPDHPANGLPLRSIWRSAQY